MALSQSPINTLPQELIGEIAGQFSGDKVRNEALPSLKLCSLVSKSFREEFQPHIFSHIVIQDFFLTQARSKSLLPKLSQLLESNRQIATYIHSLDIALSRQNDRYAASDWVLENPELPGILEQLHSLAHFSFGTLGPDHLAWDAISVPVQAAISALCKLPSLTSIGFATITQLPVSLLTCSHSLKSLKFKNIFNLDVNVDTPSGCITEFSCNNWLPGAIPFVERCPSFFSGLRILQVEARPMDTEDIQKLVTVADTSLLHFTSLSCFYSTSEALGERVVAGPYNFTKSTSLRSLTLIIQNIEINYSQFVATVYDTLITLRNPKLEELTMELRPLIFDLLNLFVDEEQWRRLDAILNQTQFPCLKKVCLTVVPPAKPNSAAAQQVQSLIKGDAIRNALPTLITSHQVVFEPSIMHRDFMEIGYTSGL